MANPMQGLIEIEYGGEPLKFKLDCAALISIEKKTGVSIHKLVVDAGGLVKIGDIVYILYQGLKAAGNEKQQSWIVENFSVGDYPKYMEIISRSINASNTGSEEIIKKTDDKAEVSKEEGPLIGI